MQFRLRFVPFVISHWSSRSFANQASYPRVSNQAPYPGVPWPSSISDRRVKQAWSQVQINDSDSFCKNSKSITSLKRNIHSSRLGAKVIYVTVTVKLDSTVTTMLCKSQLDCQIICLQSKRQMSKYVPHFKPNLGQFVLSGLSVCFHINLLNFWHCENENKSNAISLHHKKLQLTIRCQIYPSHKAKIFSTADMHTYIIGFSRFQSDLIMSKSPEKCQIYLKSQGQAVLHSIFNWLFPEFLQIQWCKNLLKCVKFIFTHIQVVLSSINYHLSTVPSSFEISKFSEHLLIKSHCQIYLGPTAA